MNHTGAEWAHVVFRGKLLIGLAIRNIVGKEKEVVCYSNIFA